MFNPDQAISEWRRKMLASGLRNTEVLNELESHLRDDMVQRTLSGLGVEEAFKRAVEQIGEAASLRHEFATAAAARGSILQKLVTIVVIANVIFGAFAIFGGVSAIVSAYNVRMRGIRFEANDWWYLRAS